MKRKILISLISISIILSGIFYFKYHSQTLMLSEIVGKTNNPAINVAIKLADFDTGLTKSDLEHLKKNKDYWLTKIKEVEAIQNPTLKQKASLELLDEMMEDPVLKKICSGFLKLGTDVSFTIIEFIL